MSECSCGLEDTVRVEEDIKGVFVQSKQSGVVASLQLIQEQLSVVAV
jgi:hypothetical protein